MNKFILTGDMPKSCSECQNCDNNIDCELPLGTDMTDDEYETSRHPQCPLQDTTNSDYNSMDKESLIALLEAKDDFHEENIHLSKELATELLEELELDKCNRATKYGLENSYSVVIDNIHHKITEETYEILKKLRNALGGNDE